MDRRSLLKSAGLAVAGGSVPAVARPSPTSGQAEPFTPLSSLALPGAREAVVGPDGETAYVALTDGFATVDVSDPAAPELLAERRDVLAEDDRGPMRRIFDVAVDGDRLAVAGPAHGLGLGGVVLYDVGDPADPRRVAFHEVIHPVHNCDLEDGTLCLTGNDPREHSVVLVNATDDEPEEAARWALEDHDPGWADVRKDVRTIHDVTVAGDVVYACFWDAGTWLLDVSDLGAPEYLGKVGGFALDELAEMPEEAADFQRPEPPGNAHYAEPGDDGTVLAVGGESWDLRPLDGHGAPSGIDLWDVSDPAAPTKRSTVDPLVPRDATFGGTWTTAHNFELVGDRLYSSWYQNGVKVHDVSDPSAPELLAHWRDPHGTRFWTARLARPGEFFVASDMGSKGSEGEDAGLYCFPDRAGDQPDQPSIPTVTPGTPSRPPAPNGTRTPTEQPTPRETPTPSPTGTVEPTDGHSPTTVGTPGFGTAGALAALGVAAWRRFRRAGRSGGREP